jgi:hypothetical protein
MVELADSPPTSSNTSESSESPPTTMIDHPFMTALISYPILSVVASHLDQTDLSNLSSTCRRAYHILRDHRRTLQNISLKCFNEAAIVTTASPKLVSIGAPGRGLVGGVMATRCARDLVRLCFSCGIPICRVLIRFASPQLCLLLLKLSTIELHTKTALFSCPPAPSLSTLSR